MQTGREPLKEKEGTIAEEETRQESTMEDSALGEHHSQTPRSIAPWKRVGEEGGCG